MTRFQQDQRQNLVSLPWSEDHQLHRQTRDPCLHRLNQALKVAATWRLVTMSTKP